MFSQDQPAHPTPAPAAQGHILLHLNKLINQRSEDLNTTMLD